MNYAPPPRSLSIYLVAGEESGDALGAALARALVQREAGGLKLAGVGGSAMAAAGIASPYPIAELSIFGFGAIPRRLPAILRRIRETADAIVAMRPDALVIIDSPDFTHRVARRVRRLAPSIPILNYVSPTVWVWRPGRARAMRAYVDCLLAILPFEPAVHVRLGGPPCLYVGHPLIERVADLRPNADEAQRRRADPPLVLALPGSRSSEIRRLLAIFGAALARLATRIGPIELVLPTVPHLLPQVREGVAGWAVTPRMVVEPGEKWAAFRTARAALAASGTVTLELALAGIPTVAAYRLPLIEEIALRLITLNSRPHSVILANLVIGENIVPEFLQRDCTPHKLAAALEPLISDTPERQRQIEGFRRLDGIMALGTAPSVKAAAMVLDVARRGRRDVAALNAPRQC
ncbi:MAG TPA: lipid-A-disaccharide synthase [Xanthobacteraceae bacterium]|nr:lipid-A-disaccharide synthase [Xanthobacteraceae bacterium]